MLIVLLLGVFDHLPLPLLHELLAKCFRFRMDSEINVLFVSAMRITYIEGSTSLRVDSKVD